MPKLLDQIRITNNRIYQNMPKGRLRQGRDGRLEDGSLTPLSSLTDDIGSVPLVTNHPLSKQSNDLTSVDMPSANKSIAKSTKVIRKGRPRMYSAQLIEETEDTFVVRIKFNVRNKLAKRYFGIPSSIPPPIEKLSRLRPPVARGNLSKDSFEDSEPLSGHQRSKRGLIQPRSGNYAVGKNGSMPRFSVGGNNKLGLREPFRSTSSDHRLSSAAAERLSESLEKDLPYHGVLPFPQCVINDTDPTASDREMFTKFSKQATQNYSELQRQMLAGTLDEDTPSATPIPQSVSHYYSRSQIEKLQFRDYLIDTWYSSPYPEEYAKNKVLYICEFCLKYMSSPQCYLRHQSKSCNSFKNHPPGTEIYRDSKARIAFWEVDGRKNIEYCQSLCLLAKLFLNSKTLYYDVEPFVFYILTEIDEKDPFTHHFVGYFSKEKLNNSDYNVSCILTLPIYQRKGYGSLMIDFSYLLSRREFKYGTPEKPLSDLGLVSYRNYWKLAVAYALRRLYDDFINKPFVAVPLTLENIAQLTGMKPSDVVFALEQLNALLKNEETGQYAISIDLDAIDAAMSKWESRGYVRLYSEYLLWKPLIYGPSGGINSAPALAFVSQPESQIPMVSNSISMITEFLKDDINNPYSFEEEAYKSIEAAIESKRLKELQMKPHGYHVCEPDSDIASPQASLPRVDDVKLANIEGDEETEAEKSGFESDFEELSEAGDDDVNGTHSIDSRLGALVQEGDIVSDDQDEVFYEAESNIEEADDDEDGADDDNADEDHADDDNADENSDNDGVVDEEEAEVEMAEEVVVTRIVPVKDGARKTRSHKEPAQSVLTKDFGRRKRRRWSPR